MLASTARRCVVSRSLLPASVQLSGTRQFQTTPQHRKDDAFDPQRTRPEEQKEGAKEEAKEANIGMGASPASKTDNKKVDSRAGGREGSKSEDGSGPAERSGQSGGGSPNKAGGTKTSGGA